MWSCRRGCPRRAASLGEWIEAGRQPGSGGLIAIELALAIASYLLGRASSLVDSLLSERYSNFASIRLMEHATNAGSGAVRKQRSAGPAWNGRAGRSPAEPRF